MKVELKDQIAELRKELDSRKAGHPLRVARGMMTQQEAEVAIGRMEAALKTLQWLDKNRAAVLQAKGNSDG